MEGDRIRKGADPARRADALAERFAEEYPSYQYALVEFLVAHLTDVARAFDGDLQQALVLAVIGQVRLQARRMADEAGAAPPEPEASAITASRLADTTGIPRETVRRKLKRLQERGWIARRPDGAWHLVVDGGGMDSPARRHFTDQDRRTRERVARLVIDMERVASPTVD